MHLGQQVTQLEICKALDPFCRSSQTAQPAAAQGLKDLQIICLMQTSGAVLSHVPCCPIQSSLLLRMLVLTPLLRLLARANCSMQDWQYLAAGCMDITLELSDDKWRPEGDLPLLWEENKDALLALPVAAVLGGEQLGRGR